MIQLHENREAWTFACQSCEVQMVQIDFRLSLRIADADNSVRTDISNQCILKSGGKEFLLDPEQPESLAPILSFFNEPVKSVVLAKTGHLAIEFVNGGILKVEPMERFEAWEVGCLIDGNGHLFVCAPGGEVAFFKGDESAKSD